MGLLWVIAVALIVVGIWELVNGAAVLGIVLIVLGLLIGPFGYSVLGRDDEPHSRSTAAVTT